MTVTVVVPVMSLCPCSKAIADYGAHNQRSHLAITVRPLPGAGFAGRTGARRRGRGVRASCTGCSSAADEKYVTERAYEQPRFVEDLVRGIAARLAADPRIDGFIVEAENFESIHNHSAYARIARNF